MKTVAYHKTAIKIKILNIQKNKEILKFLIWQYNVVKNCRSESNVHGRVGMKGA